MSLKPPIDPTNAAESVFDDLLSGGFTGSDRPFINATELYDLDKTGATDVTTDLETAMAAVGSGTVWLADGTYLVTGLDVPTGVHLTGSKKVTIKAAANAGATTITVAAGAKISGFKVDGNEPNQTADTNNVRLNGNRAEARDIDVFDSAYAAIIIAADCDHCTVAGCRIYKVNAAASTRFHGIYVAGNTSADAPEHTLITNNHVEDTAFSNIAVFCGAWTTVTDNKCQRSAANGVGDSTGAGDGIAAYSADNSHLLIANNTFEDHENHFVHAGGDHVTLVGNHGENAGSEGYMVASDPNAAPTPSLNCHVSGNTAITTRDLGAPSSATYHIEGYENVTVGPELAVGADLVGMTLKNCLDVAIYPGVIKDSGSHGINMIGCTAVTITGGVIRDCASSGIQLTNGNSQTGLTAEADNNTITLADHGYVDGQAIWFTALTGGTGLSTNTTYYVRDRADDTFKVATSPGGSAVDITVDATAGTVVSVTVDVSITGTTLRGNGGWGVLGTNTEKVRIDAVAGNNTSGNFSLASNRTTNWVAPNKTDTSRDVASTAALVLPVDLDFVNITGTADITSIQTSWPGRRVTLKFAGAAASTGLTDGSNLKLSASLAYTADDAITLVSDGTSWYESGDRSVN